MRIPRALIYLAAGAALMTADFVNWRNHGVLASSTLADVLRMVHAHELAKPQWYVPLIASLPLVGTAVVALALWDHGWAAWLRGIIALVGAAMAALLLLRVGDGSIAAYGPGAWLAASGAVLLVIGVLFDVVRMMARGRTD